MPAIRTVSNIKANLLRPALTSHFEVELGIPDPLRSWLGQSQDKLNLMCSEAVLPGSQLATIEILNDYQGVTERHAYRRQFDQSIDLTFYVDAEKYLPIKFFEKWISYVMNEGTDNDMAFENYSYRARYPAQYTATGLTVTKFEKDYKSQLQYEFVKSFPLAITSMPISYEASNLLKVSVQMTYIRYILKGNNSSLSTSLSGILLDAFNPFQMAQFNAGGIRDSVANFAGNTVRDAVRNLF